MYRRYQNRAMWLICAMAGAIYRPRSGEASAFTWESESAASMLSCRRAQGGGTTTRDKARTGGEGGRREAPRREAEMTQGLRVFAVVGVAVAVLTAGSPASAQKQGGILRLYMVDSPA